MSNEPLQYETPSAVREGWSKHEVASLALKLFGLYALFQALPLLGYLPVIVTTTAVDRTSMIAWGTIHLLWGVVGGVLLLMSDRLAWLVLPRPRGGGLAAPPATDLQAIAFSVVGVLLVVRGIPDIGQFILSLLMRSQHADDFFPYYQTDWGQLAMGALQIVLGVVLFLQARGLALFWHKLRTAGVPQAGEP